MLNVNEIAARIENPSITKAQDSEDLRLLTEKYPYTQLFSILYLQSLKQAGDIHFEDELKKHSFRITDRAQLFNLIESDSHQITHSVSAEPTTIVEDEKVEMILEETEVEEVIDEAPIEEEIVEEVIETAKEEIQTSTPFRQAQDDALSPPKLEEEEIVPDEPELAAGEAEIKPESNEVKETVSAWTEPISEAPSEEKETILDSSESNPVIDDAPVESKVDSVEETITEAETNEITSEKEPEKEELYSVEEAFKDEPEAEKESKDQLDQTIEHHIYAANYRLDGLSPEEEQQLKEKEAQNQKEPSLETENKEDLSFTSWLQANDNYVEPEEEAVTAKVVPEFSDFDPSNPLFGEQERPKKEFFSAPKKAKKSLTEETVPVSETLAKVYAMQGNYPKAIAAYEQLMLTIPEKKSFFASLIEDLKTKLNT